jgi:hypothetical protein
MGGNPGREMFAAAYVAVAKNIGAAFIIKPIDGDYPHVWLSSIECDRVARTVHNAKTTVDTGEQQCQYLSLTFRPTSKFRYFT